MSEVYFKKFKVKNRNWHWWRLITETKNGALYYLHTSGKVFVRYKNGVEKELKGYIKRNDLYLKINGKEQKMKNLVASEVFINYKKGMNVILNDGDPRNCDVYNLSVYTKQQLGKLTGGKNSRKISIVINGVVYPSIRKAAKANFVSYQTLSDFLNKRYKTSVISHLDISEHPLSIN